MPNPVPVTAAVADNILNICFFVFVVFVFFLFFFFQRKSDLAFHVNHLLTDNFHEMSSLFFSEK